MDLCTGGRLLVFCGLLCTRLSGLRSRQATFFVDRMKMVSLLDRLRTLFSILLKQIIHSPVAVPSVVRVHFTVMRDHARYYNIRVWVIRPEFFQPATNSTLTSFTYRHPPACSLAGLNRIRRVNRLAPCKLIVRKRFENYCRLPAWPSLQNSDFSAGNSFL